MFVGVFRGQEMMSDSLELELKVIKSCLRWVLGPARSGALNC